MTAPVCSMSSSIAVLLMTFVFWIQWPWLVEQTQIFYILSRIRVKETLKNVELVDVVMVLGVRRLVTGLPVRSPPPVAYVFRQVAGITARYAPSPKKIEATPPMISRPRTSPVFSSER